MLENANFLCEIGTEEIPAGYLPSMIAGFKKIFKQQIEENRIPFRDIEVYATPRRLAVLISELADKQVEEEIEIKGPSVKASYNENGEITKALKGFINGNNISESDIFKKETDKGAYIFAKKKTESSDTVSIIPGIIDSAIKNINTPKKMKWSDKTILFPRPVTYLLVLFKDKPVDFELSGIKSSNLTRGHYIQHNQMIEINGISSYESVLKKNGIILDHNKRKDIIYKELLKASGKLNSVLIEDEELLNTVTFLAENPTVITCEFSKEFLKIPDIVLITEMKEHQKYFAVKDKSGKLLPYFLVISNNPRTDNIKKGNVRVISARFNDAAFFYNEDRRTKLSDKVDSLKSVLFHKDLGTIYDKILRVSFISDIIINTLNIKKETADRIKRAIRISKADLVTAMVFEFPSLQGHIGKIYALLDGEDEETAAAIDDLYRPRFQGDELPDNIISIVVSVSEKIDNIFGSFSVGNIPKGSEDPYALKRQATAILEILIKNKINIAIDDILKQCASKYKNGDSDIIKILEFFSARAKTIFQDKGYQYDEIEACLSTGYYNFHELLNRADSIHTFRKNENFSEMLLSFKRMNNILSIFLRKNPDYELSFDPKKLEEKSEEELYIFFDSKKNEINEYIRENKYTNLFNLLTNGKIIIDNFFENVMVMSEKRDLRDNRLGLIKNILMPFKNLLDFSKISD